MSKPNLELKRYIELVDKVPCPNDMQFKRYIQKMYPTPCGTLLYSTLMMSKFSKFIE